jgi:hypothetical protein
MTYNVIFAKHFDEAGLGIDYPTDFLQVAEGVIEDCTLIEMRPPTNSRLEDHGDCEAFYCSRCKSSFSIAEINPSSASYRPPCPHCESEIASEDESGTELEAIRMQSAELHIKECQAGVGEEEWQYEVADQDAGYFESALDRCQTVVRYRARPQTPWSGWAGQMNRPPDARG